MTSLPGSKAASTWPAGRRRAGRNERRGIHECLTRYSAEASGPAARSLDTVTAWPAYSPGPGPVSDRESWARVIGQARCADGSLDPDQWFPVSAEAGNARREAAAAIAICQVCPVRGQCLALSLRHWDVGQNGIWGGLVAAERARLRRRMLAHRAGALRYFTDASGLEVHLHRPQPVS